MFGVKIVVADLAMEYPWEKNWFVMQLLFEMGYPWEILQRFKPHAHFSAGTLSFRHSYGFREQNQP
jgi:hypothetical protein